MLLLLFLGGGGAGAPPAPVALYRGTVNTGHGVSTFVGVTYLQFVTGVGTDTVRM